MYVCVDGSGTNTAPTSSNARTVTIRSKVSSDVSLDELQMNLMTQTLPEFFSVSPKRVVVLSPKSSIELANHALTQIKIKPPLSDAVWTPLLCNDLASADAVLGVLEDAVKGGDLKLSQRLQSLPLLRDVDDFWNYAYEELESLDNTEAFALVGCFGTLMLLVIIFVGYSKIIRKDNGSVGVLFTPVVSLLDIVTDTYFSVQLFRSKDQFFWPSVGSLAAAALCNIIFMIYFLVREMKEEKFTSWLRENIVFTAALAFVGLSNAECLGVVSCNVLGHPLFSAPVSARGRDILSYSGLITNFLEDIPQLVMQLLVLSSPTAENAGLLTQISVGVTSASLVFGIPKRGILCLIGQSSASGRGVESIETKHRMELELQQI